MIRHGELAFTEWVGPLEKPSSLPIRSLPSIRVAAVVIDRIEDSACCTSKAGGSADQGG
jgi:hypothetical protein